MRENIHFKAVNEFYAQSCSCSSGIRFYLHVIGTYCEYSVLVVVLNLRSAQTKPFCRFRYRNIRKKDEFDFGNNVNL